MSQVLSMTLSSMSQPAAVNGKVQVSEITADNDWPSALPTQTYSSRAANRLKILIAVNRMTKVFNRN